jgi:RNA polymerase sigma factor (sigma-70 family)
MEQSFSKLADASQTGSLHVAGKPAKIISLRKSKDGARSFTQLYDQYYPEVRKFASILGRLDEVKAEDIVQDVFLKLWQRWDSTAEIHSIRNYLFIMVRNHIINERKLCLRWRKVVYRVSNASLVAAETTENDLRCRHIQAKYAEGLRALPPRIRLAYELKEKAGMDQSDIAKKMAISRSVVKQHTAQAKKRLKAYLDAQGCF